ncbi:hypothetical protein SKAU_G00097120 [Synaphobranchus kaupii]|uniref:Uncharacterized protein n=1 Tax=Synaphobranchus kaupii TaxID=118154 RepID=A0A9Q1FXI9_SYNKA|nr:hypothetical protein SKAU_G00097120 [Synaphobranchus kaupii]
MWAERNWTAPNRKLNCKALNNPITTGNLRWLLGRNLDQVPEESTDWSALRTATHGAASEALSLSRIRHQDWFDNNFYDAIKALYSPRKQTIVPVRSADGDTLHLDFPPQE